MTSKDLFQHKAFCDSMTVWYFSLTSSSEISLLAWEDCHDHRSLFLIMAIGRPRFISCREPEIEVEISRMICLPEDAQFLSVHLDYWTSLPLHCEMLISSQSWNFSAFSLTMCLVGKPQKASFSARKLFCSYLERLCGLEAFFQGTLHNNVYQIELLKYR